MNTSADFIAKRSVALDCIRATAIVMVVVFHVATRYPADFLDPVAKLFRIYGTLGVDVFFPLSGYLITAFLIRHSEPGSIRTFFLRRVFRILPLYFVAVTIYFAAMKFFELETTIIDRIWAPYTFLTGWIIFVYGVEGVPYTVTWSLSVEEFSYVLIGLAALISRKKLLWFLITLALFSTGLRLYLNIEGHDNIYYFPLARLDSIALGGIVAVLGSRGQRVITWLLAGIIASFTLRQFGGALSPTLLYTLVTLVTCFAIAVSESWLSTYRGALATAYARTGFYSYFIYLFHFMVLEAQLRIADLLGFGMLPFWINAALCLLLSQATAALSFRYFEGPLMLAGRGLEKHKVSRLVESLPDEPAKRSATEASLPVNRVGM